VTWQPGPCSLFARRVRRWPAAFVIDPPSVLLTRRCCIHLQWAKGGMGGVTHRGCSPWAGPWRSAGRVRSPAFVTVGDVAAGCWVLWHSASDEGRGMGYSPGAGVGFAGVCSLASVTWRSGWWRRWAGMALIGQVASSRQAVRLGWAVGGGRAVVVVVGRNDQMKNGTTLQFPAPRERSRELRPI